MGCVWTVFRLTCLGHKNMKPYKKFQGVKDELRTKPEFSNGCQAQVITDQPDVDFITYGTF